MVKSRQWIQQLLPDQNKRLYFAFALVWVILCQVGFFFLQKNLGHKTLFSLQNQLRQELDFSNYQYLIRSINDFQNSGSIKCSIVKMRLPSAIEILDLRYMNGSDECQRSEWWLQGAHIQQDLQSLNGDVYSFDFVSNNGVIFDFALWSFRLFGLVLIYMARRNLILRLRNESLRFEAEIDHAKRLFDLSRAVAHDIRSPLSALNSLANSVSGLTPEQFDIVNSVVKRINGIADDLLRKEKNIFGEFLGGPYSEKWSVSQLKISSNEYCEVIPILEKLVQEKKLEYQSNSLVKIELRPSSVSRHQKVLISEKSLFRILSNIINNSVEAVVDDGSIFIEVELRDVFINIIVTDFGKGIPDGILEKLKTSPITYGKYNSTSGSGIGIFSANEALKKLGGDLQIQSKIDIGTKILIAIPT